MNMEGSQLEYSERLEEILVSNHLYLELLSGGVESPLSSKQVR